MRNKSDPPSDSKNGLIVEPNASTPTSTCISTTYADALRFRTYLISLIDGNHNLQDTKGLIIGQASRSSENEEQKIHNVIFHGQSLLPRVGEISCAVS